ncbi:hypothetical protein BDV98DRAFT_415511 [Pterulicium gracile]|uniref:Uncharacterized protein n=1 Tax=Pterulicium gracile TaxID=1884261 RepID=A0A5C3QRE1_9AGAR|nr:hypothetical protein BDV98DRAFT_415511 [Pterula gracilis]
MAAEHLLEDDHSKVHRYRNGTLPDVVFAGPQDASSSSSSAIAPWEHASDTRNSADDLYQNLSNFTFGAANQSRTSISDVVPDDVVGPFNDVTPRPSVAPHGSETYPFQLHTFGQYRSGESLSRVPSHNTFGGPASGEYMSSSSTSLSSRTSGHGDFTTSGHTSLASDRTKESMQFSSDEFDDTDAFGNQPLTFNHDRFSSGEDSDYEDDGRVHRDPPHLPAYHRASTSGKVPTRGSIAHQRRGSLPMPIPQPIARDREDSLATLRRPSRSLDDDLKAFHAARAAAAAGAVPVPGADPASEPQSKADWRELEHRASMSSLKGKEREVEPDLGNPNDWIAEFQEQFKGGITSFPLDASAPPSSPLVPPGRRKSSIMSSWSRFAPGGSRRPSTATTGTNDDAFHKHVKRWDPFYSERRTDWVFTRERAEDGLVTRPPADRTVAPFLYPDTPTSPRTSMSVSSERTLASESVAGSTARRKPVGTGMTRGSEEIWRCLFVGRYKVVRREIHPKSHDNSKPPQQRLEVQPFADPYSKAEGRSPLTPFFVHKHSRALAFSITKFRIKDKEKEREKEKDGRPSRGLSAHATNPSKMSVMLAPQRVQEQFTNTRTTNKLETHGQLGDGNMRNSDMTLVYASQVRERKKSTMEREKKDKLKKKKEKEREDSESATLRRHYGRDVDRETTSATSSVASSSPASSSRDVFTPPPASAPVLSSGSPSFRRQISSRSLHAASAPPGESVPPVPESPLATRTPMRRMGLKHHLQSDADDDYIEDQPRRTRTPHSEAFGTMDASVIQERHRQDFQHPDGEGKSILRRIIGNSAKDGGARGNSAAKPYQPPWTMLAPRSQQEENERVVADLNTSFQGVGLLPTKINAKSRKRGQSNAKLTRTPVDNVLQDVPENALYMLIPLWPTYIGVHSPPPTIPAEKRHFLLVHYIAFDNDRPSAAVEKKKGGRSATSSMDDSTSGTSTTMSYRDEHSILLTSFRCSARRVAYHELAGSNVLAPNEGLCVSGQIAHALEHLPQHIQQENASDVIIAVCQSRDNGIELIPEGFNRLGLCYAKKDEGRLKVLPSEEDQIEEDELLLTPIGRAAAEMAWLGCLALTSFGTA